MAMSKREKFLAMGVGGVAIVLAAQYFIGGMQAKLETKQASLTSLKNEIDGLQKINTKGMIDGKRLDQLKPKSLPSNAEAATAQYKDWLSGVAQKCGLEKIQVDVINTVTTRSAAFTAHQFKLTGECRLDSMMKLLGMYYDQDYLHRIRNLKLTSPSDDLDRVAITLTSEALSLARAEPAQKPTGNSSGRLAKSVEEYEKAILGRNPFSPPNQPPRLALSRSVEVPRDRDWSLDLKATDPDPAHQVKFEVMSELPEGLRFDAKSGRLAWTPKSNGDYEVRVRATDTGFPPRSIEEKFVLKVTDPPKPPPPTPEPPKFDPATQTFVSAMVNGRSGAEAWIRSKTDTTMFRVSVGDQINIGSVKGKVVDVNIDEQFIEIDSEGKHWTLGMGDYLEPTFKKSQTN